MKETNTNEKVLSMYRAVWEMIQEGQNVYQMKVIDITNRAGIGKGTAYEYFRSKEEIVARAISYQADLEFETIRNKLEEQDSLRAAFEVCYDWLDAYQNRMESLIHLMKEITPYHKEFQKGIACMEANIPEGSVRVQSLLQILVRLGRKDRIISENIPNEFAGLQLLSQMVGYFTYIRFASNQISGNRQSRDFLYQSFVKGMS